MDDKNNFRHVAEFYNGKTLFITGAGGYLGGIFLEVLLRCLPGIVKIYILLRPRKNIDPESRKHLIFQKPYFKKLLEENPNVVEKVQVIPGNVDQPNLGMSDEDLQRVIDEVSIVFHGAATVNFFKKLRDMVTSNALAVIHAIELCRKIKKLDVLVYTSTAYSNSDFQDIEERVYRLPLRAERFLRALENNQDGELERLISTCRPNSPNNYTISKLLAENVVNDLAEDLPVAIVRPSVVFSSWKGALPGYFEEDRSGLAFLGMAAAKNFCRSFEAYKLSESEIDLVPVDISANTHVVAAWSVATQRSASPLIVNCCAHPRMKARTEYFCNYLLNMAHKNMQIESCEDTPVKLVENKYLYKAHAIYEHLIPGLVLDTLRSLKGSKKKYINYYEYVEDFYGKRLSYFLTQRFNFSRDNYNKLNEQLTLEDKETFYLDMSNIKFESVMDDLMVNSWLDWMTNKTTKEKFKRILSVRRIVKNVFLGLSILLLAWILYQILFIIM